jgi:Response regulator containing CheY-like receiver, AAA-type ATPase, and DNA-binding domains
MQLSDVLPKFDSNFSKEYFLSDRVEAVCSLLVLVQREIESLKQLRSVEEKHMENEKFCLNDEVERFEADLIRLALVKTNGHQRQAARMLGIKATTLHAKIKKYGIDLRPDDSQKSLIA